jgi:hypothetical protein
VFVTFESNKAFQVAIKNMKSKKSWITSRRTPDKKHVLFGVHPIIKKAPEPSNIIWENYSISSRTVIIRKIKVFSFMAIVYISLFYLSIRMYTKD